jgi:hypothetical protein
MPSATSISAAVARYRSRFSGGNLPRPSQTELDQAAPIVQDYNQRVLFFEFCNELYKDNKDCQNFREPEPDDKIKDAERIVGREEAFNAEVSKNRSYCPLIALPLSPIAGVGIGGFLL